VADTGFGVAPIYTAAQFGSLVRNDGAFHIIGLPGSSFWALNEIPNSWGAFYPTKIGDSVQIHGGGAGSGTQYIAYALDSSTGYYKPVSAQGMDNTGAGMFDKMIMIGALTGLAAIGGLAAAGVQGIEVGATAVGGSAADAGAVSGIGSIGASASASITPLTAADLPAISTTQITAADLATMAPVTIAPAAPALAIAPEISSFVVPEIPASAPIASSVDLAAVAPLDLAPAGSAGLGGLLQDSIAAAKTTGSVVSTLGSVQKIIAPPKPAPAPAPRPISFAPPPSGRPVSINPPSPTVGHQVIPTRSAIPPAMQPSGGIMAQSAHGSMMLWVVGGILLFVLFKGA
jgi:hypothetical protein